MKKSTSFFKKKKKKKGKCAGQNVTIVFIDGAANQTHVVINNSMLTTNQEVCSGGSHILTWPLQPESVGQDVDRTRGGLLDSLASDVREGFDQINSM